MIALAQNVETIYGGRIIVGIAAALSGIADNSYLNEIAPMEYRGRVISTYEILTCVGVVLAFLVDLCFSGMDGGWRYMFGLPALFALAQAFAMLWVPETPMWLAQHGQSGLSSSILLQLPDTFTYPVFYTIFGRMYFI